MAVNPGGTGKKPPQPVPQRPAGGKSPSPPPAAGAKQPAPASAKSPPPAISAESPAPAGAKSPVPAGNGKPKSSSANAATPAPTRKAATPATSKPTSGGAPEMKKLGRYLIVRKIGQGGMGAVYLATDTQLKRQVALKVLPREKAENPTLVKRFKAEATAAAQLRHENIVAIHDAGEADGLLYIALEYIDGVDAHTTVSKRGPIQPQRAMDIVRQTALALQHAYSQRIVHRDIKPSNVLIARDGTVKLTDMGLARSVDESLETNITRAGTTVGTVDYMSPEQARNSKAADTRSDLYSLGATWYHLLAGHPPFPEGSMLNKLTAHATKARPDIRDENDDVPEGTAVMIKRLMSIDPKDRYQTPGELLADLENERLTRGPMSLKDLAALAQEADDDDDSGPQSKYQRPAAQEAKDLMAPTAEIPVHQAKGAEVPEQVKTDSGTIKMLAIGGVAIVAIGIIGWIASQYGNVVSTPVKPSVFVQPSEPQPVTKANDSDPKPRSTTPGLKDEPPDKEAVPKSDAPVAVVGQLYLPPMMPLGRDNEVRYYPDWIKASGTPAPSAVKTVLVGGGINGFDQVATLEEAIKSLPESGGIIELATNGPFFLGPTQLNQPGTIVLRAAAGTAPVVVLVGDPDQAYDALLQLGRGALTLEGLHLQVFARHFANDDPLVWFNSRGGDIAAINCTFTLNGTRAGRTFVFGAEGKSARSPEEGLARTRLFCRGCVVRGEALGAFQLDQTAVELVTSRSLFATGDTPVLTLTNSELPDAEPVSDSTTPAKSPTRPVATSGGESGKTPMLKPTAPAPKQKAITAARSVRILSCTVLCRRTAIELSPGANVASPPSTELLVVNSVLSGITSASGSPTLLAMPGWQMTALPTAGQSSYPKLQCLVEASLISGWQKLILEEPGSTNVVRDGAAWKSVWQNQTGLDESQFASVNWPTTPPSDWAAAGMNSLMLPADLGRKGTDGQPPGIAAAELADPAAIALARADHLADRARYPVFGLAPMPVNKKIDVVAQDLGRTLAGDWPSGMSITVTGGGTIALSPIAVKGKSLRIEFQSDADKPLVFVPATTAKPGEHEAMFVVESGSLELIGGQFKFPNGSREGVPQLFLSVFDGDFSLKRCQVMGQTFEPSSQFLGLIRWKRSRPESKHADAPFERNSGLIVDSALLSSGKLLEADLRNRTLVLRNSLLASIGDLCDFDVKGFDSRTGATVDATNCSFGAGGKFLFQVAGTRETEKVTQPLTLFVQHSVMLNLQELSGSANPPLLLSVRDHVLANQQVSWWDHGNGYQSGWSHFVRSPDAPTRGPQSFDADWCRLWDGPRIDKPLTTAGGVRLTTKLPPRTKVTPGDFTLAKDCAASTWGPDQSSIGTVFAGANATTSTTRPQPQPNTKTEPPKPTTSPKTTTPNKNVVKPNIKPGF